MPRKCTSCSLERRPFRCTNGEPPADGSSVRSRTTHCARLRQATGKRASDASGQGWRTRLRRCLPRGWLRPPRPQAPRLHRRRMTATEVSCRGDGRGGPTACLDVRGSSKTPRVWYHTRWSPTVCTRRRCHVGRVASYTGWRGAHMTHHAAGVRGFDWAARGSVLAGGYDPFHGGRPGGSFSLCDDDLLCRAPGFAK